MATIPERERQRQQETMLGRHDTGQLFLHGIVGGIIAGLIFALGEMLINVALGLPFLGPVRLISTIVLGPEAAQPAYPLMTSLVTGVVVHMIFSMLYGVIFAFLMAYAGQLAASGWMLTVWGAIFGLALWVINFLIIAPIAFPQFTEVNQLWNGFFAHTFLYGAPLGAYIAAVRSKLA